MQIKNKILKEINGRGIFFLLISCCLLIFMLGMTFNFLAIVYNDGKMPVHSKYAVNDNQHFGFENPDDVEYYFLTDILKYKTAYFSIGDVVLLIATLLLVLLIGNEVKQTTKKILNEKGKIL